MIIEMQNLINDNFDSFYNIIKLRINYLLFKHKRFLYIDLKNTMSNTIQKIKGESKSEFIKRIFREDPLFIINNLIDEIYSFSYNKKFDINPSNTYFNTKLDKKIFIREKIKISEIKFLSDVKSLNVEIKSAIDFNSSVIHSNFYIESINRFTSEIIIFGEIEFDELADHAIDNMHLDLKFEYKGLLFNNNLPIWLENIIEGVLYQSEKNTKHAVFNYFVAFDSFVQTIYNQIYKHYKKKEFEESLISRFNVFVNDLQEEFIDKIIEEEYGLENDFFTTEEEYDDAYDEAFDEVSLLKKDIIHEIKKIYLEDYDEMLEISKKEMHSDYEYYSRQDKKLIDQKLKDVETILDINLNTINFSGLSRLKNSIKIIEKYRNIIAHGNGSNLNFTGDEFYEIFTYLISIVYNYDFDKSYWKELISYD